MKQQNSNNTYVEFRFEDSLRKYERPPSKKVKCSMPKCNQCIRKNYHLSQAERLDRIVSAKKHYGRSNQRFNNNSRDVSPAKGHLLPDFMMSSSLKKSPLKQSTLRNLGRFFQLNEQTPSKKISIQTANLEVGQSKQGNSINELIISQQPISEEPKSIDMKQFWGKSIEVRQIEEIVEKEELLILEQENNNVIGNVEFRTEDKEEIMGHLDSILQGKSSPIAQYLFDVFDAEKFSQEERRLEKQPQSNKIEEETPFENIKVEKKQSSNEESLISVSQLQQPYQMQSQIEDLPGKVFLGNEKSQRSQSKKQLNKKRRRRNIDLLQEPSSGGHLKVQFGTEKYLLSVRYFDKFIKPYSGLDEIVDAIVQQKPYLDEVRDRLKEAVRDYLSQEHPNHE